MIDKRAADSDCSPQKVDVGHTKTCRCPPHHLSCISAKEWVKCQIGVWRVGYERRDVRDKEIHPATFPLSLARKVIELFTHEGELVLDPFVGSGTTLVAARDLGRNAVGFDLQERYIQLCKQRLSEADLFGRTKQIPICDDARNAHLYIEPETVKLIWTSPPYANTLNRKRKNKSRRSEDRRNAQFGRIEQYSQDERDLGTLSFDRYVTAMGDIFGRLVPLLLPGGHCVLNVGDIWWEDRRILLHTALIQELSTRGLELRNIVIWDKTNLVNRTGIFGWPSNYITIGVTFEYLLHFRRAN